MSNELLVPRKSISFSALEEGRFIPLSKDVPEILKRPMVRSNSGELSGFESGWRSGLLYIDDQLYKIKSCRPVGGKRGNQPKGSHTLSSAQFEADEMLLKREAFLKGGFDYPLEPIGIWVYDHVIFNGEPNAATIYKAKGDTRLDELIWWVERTPYEYATFEYINQITNILTKLGYQTGKRLKFFHDNNFSWDSSPISEASNAHHGNIVVFPTEKDKVGVGMVDFDISTGYSKGDPKELEETIKATQRNDHYRFVVWMTDAEVISRPRRFRHYHYYVAGNIVGRMVNKIAPELVQDKDHETIGRAAAYLLRQLNPNEEMRSLTKELLYGFKKGYGGNITNIEKDLSKEISWNELSNIIRKTDRIRPDLKRRLKNELGTEAGTQRVRELAKLY